MKIYERIVNLSLHNLILEMSFITERDIQNLTEQLFAYVWDKVLGKKLEIPFERMTYDHAFATYGSDKPDIRFDLPIHDASDLFKDSELKFLKSVLEKGGKIGALHIRGHDFSRGDLDKWVERAQELGAKGLLYVRVKSPQDLESPVAKFLSPDFFSRMQDVF